MLREIPLVGCSNLDIIDELISSQQAHIQGCLVLDGQWAGTTLGAPN
jgi:hypothetical protein